MSNIIVNNPSPPTINITEIIFNGATATCDSGCPCNSGINCQFTTNQIGTYTLSVGFSNGILNGCIEITDSYGISQNQDIPAGQSGFAVFDNVIYDGNTVLTINIQDGTCATLPTTTPT
jgi:hypothetical protein